MKLPFLWDICIKFISPAILLTILIMALSADLNKAYGGYPLWLILIFGAGSIVVTLIPSFLFAAAGWPKEKTEHKHTPEEEHLLT